MNNLKVFKLFLLNQKKISVIESGFPCYPYLVTAIHCFQFQNRTLISVSEWCVLMNAIHNMKSEESFQQSLRVISHVTFIVNSDLISHSLLPP